MNQSEIDRVQKYLRDKFGAREISLRTRPQDPDSVEVLLSGEFLGLIYRDDEDGNVSYDFNMAILEIDLPVTA